MSNLKIALLLSYICIASISASIITPALPIIEKFFSLNTGQLEWVVSIFLFGYVIGQLIYGPIANRYGRLFSLRAGMIINIIGIIICITANYLVDYNLLLLGRFITALGASAGLVCTFILINELLSSDRAKQAMSFAIVSFTLGIGISVAIGGVVAKNFSWNLNFYILLFHGLAMLALSWCFTETLKESKKINLVSIFSGYINALKSLPLVSYSIGVGLVSAVGYCYSASAPLYAKYNLLLEMDEYGYFNTINMIGMFGSGFLGSFLLKKFSPKKSFAISMFFLFISLIALGIISFFNINNIILFFTITMFLYLFSGSIFPSASFLASNSISDKASASGMMSFLNMGSAMLAVIIMGYLPFKPIEAFSTILIAFFILAITLIFISEKCKK